MLFDQIPPNFFLLLTGNNKTLYWECIYKIYTIMNHQLSFGILKELVVDELQFLLENLNQQFLVEEEAFEGTRDKATYIFRRLLECGWLAKEETINYEERIHFQDYAIEVVKVLHHIAENDKMEYQGYIYTIYTLVHTQKAGSTGNGVILSQIYENTDQLITGLKSLNANIKKYIDKLTRYENIADIMKVLFDDYRVNIVDKAYHRLKTSDNVSKYRPTILEALEGFFEDDAFITLAAQEISEMKELEEEEAKGKVLEMLSEVKNAFDSMDEIIEEIDRKNSSYQRAAINRAKFLLSQGEDVTSQIKEILIAMRNEINREQLGLNSIYEMEFMEKLINLYGIGFLDEESLYKPIEGKKSFKPEALEVKEIDHEKRKAKLSRMKEKLLKTMSVEQIEAYVREVMGDKPVIKASQFPLTTREAFIKLIYIRLYGQRKRIAYRIVPKEIVKIGAFRFRDFEIWRKNLC